MKLATWNLNGVRARQARLEAWIQAHQPDVLCLQETKCQDAQFPKAALEGLGYHVEVSGQKTFNGVAILSKKPMTEVQYTLPGDAGDDQRRFIAATVGGVRVLNGYIPNGQAVDAEAYHYKLGWLGRLQALLAQEHQPSDKVVVVGDFNVALEDRDIWDPKAFPGGMYCTGPERKAIQGLIDWGLRDAFRAGNDEDKQFSWFDYRNRSFARKAGMRIDLILASEPMLKKVKEVTIDLEERKGEKPSDHAPVVAEFKR